MKIMKKISLLTVALLAFQSTYCSINQRALSEINIEEAILKLPEYQNYIAMNQLDQTSNDLFDYTKTVESKFNDSSISFGQSPFKIEFDAKDNLFNSGKAITIIVRYLNNGKVWKQTERWVSRNASYLTWSNAALAAGTLGALGAGAYLASSGMGNNNSPMLPQIEPIQTPVQPEPVAIEVQQPTSKPAVNEDQAATPRPYNQTPQIIGKYATEGMKSGVINGAYIGDKIGTGVGSVGGAGVGVWMGAEEAARAGAKFGPRGIVAGGLIGAGLGAFGGASTGILTGGVAGGATGLAAGTVVGTAAAALDEAKNLNYSAEGNGLVGGGFLGAAAGAKAGAKYGTRGMVGGALLGGGLGNLGGTEVEKAVRNYSSADVKNNVAQAGQAMSNAVKNPTVNLENDLLDLSQSGS